MREDATSEAAQRRLKALSTIIASVAKRRASGELLTDEHVIAQHPHLMPELTERLRELLPIEEARLQAELCAETISFDWRARGSGHDKLVVSGTSSHVVLPREFGSIRLLREIGRGAMGVVYLARDRMLQRDVAVKFLLDAVAGDDEPGFRSFLEGARAAATVRHPNLTLIHQADIVGNIPFMVMEFVDGPTLAQVLRHGGPLSLPAVVAVLEPVAAGLTALHARGFIHRDIKPSNILVDAGGAVYVTDFGLTCAHRSPTGTETRGEVRQAGTPAYMAPESFGGDVSPRSDVYALGITTYELLTGTLPFRGSLDSIVRLHQTEALQREPLGRRRITTALIEVLDRAAHKEARFRYKSPEHFVRAVRSAAGDIDWSQGQVELCRLIDRCRDPEKLAAQLEESPSTGPYYDELAALATARRSDREGAVPQTGPSTSPRRVAGSTSDVLRVDLPCSRCGYNLFGLPGGGACAECGMPLSESLRSDRLIFAHDAWLGRVQLGVLIAVVGLVVLLSAPTYWALSRTRAAWPLGVLALVSARGAAFLARREQRRDAPADMRRRRLAVLLGCIAATIVVPPSYLWLAREVRARLDRAFEQRSSRWVDYYDKKEVDYDNPIALVIRGRRISNVPAQVAVLSIHEYPYLTLLGLVGLGAVVCFAGQVARRIPDATLARRARAELRLIAAAALTNAVRLAFRVPGGDLLDALYGYVVVGIGDALLLGAILGTLALSALLIRRLSTLRSGRIEHSAAL